MPVIVRYYSSGSPSENNNTVLFQDSSVLVSAALEEQYSCFIFCLNECGLSISLFLDFSNIGWGERECTTLCKSTQKEAY